MCNPYIESATAFSDYYIDDEQRTQFPIFVGRQKWTFTISRTQNVSVDLKYYDVLCL